MKISSEVLSRAVNTNSRVVMVQERQEPVRPVIDLNTKKQVINDIFSLLQANWPGQFKNHYGGQEQQDVRKAAKRSWLQSAELWKLTPEEIHRCVCRAIDNSEYLPTSVAHLLKFHRANYAEAGLPTELEALREVLEHSHEPLAHQWSHRAVYLAGKKIWHNLRCASTEKERANVRELYLTEYRKVAQKFADGELGNGSQSLAIEDQSGNTHQQAERYSIFREQQERQRKGIPDQMTREQALASMGLGL